jgi:hypothetical protein
MPKQTLHRIASVGKHQDQAEWGDIPTGDLDGPRMGGAAACKSVIKPLLREPFCSTRMCIDPSAAAVVTVRVQ